MKRLTLFLSALTLGILTACHPTQPKPAPPQQTPPAPPPVATASATLSAPAPQVETTASQTVSSAVELPPAPLVGPAGPAQPENTTGITPPPMPLVPAPPSVHAAGAIRILAPEGQIGDGLRHELSTKLGVEVTVDTFANNDDALKKLDAAPYDLALVSYRIISHLIADQKLAALPALPAALQPEPKYLHHFFDIDNKYSLPYAFSLAGMAVRSGQVKSALGRWSDLFNETNYKVARLPDDSAFESSLLAKAGMRNSSLAAATPPAPGEEEPIQVDSIAALKKKFATQPGWLFVLPGEGSLIYLYCAVVPANTPAPDKTAALLSEIFNPEITARLAEENYLGVTQEAAYKTLPPASTGDALIYPRHDIMDKSVFVRSGFRPIPAPAAAQ